MTDIGSRFSALRFWFQDFDVLSLGWGGSGFWVKTAG